MLLELSLEIRQLVDRDERELRYFNIGNQNIAAERFRSRWATAASRSLSMSTAT
jgi:hypothetical protein